MGLSLKALRAPRQLAQRNQLGAINAPQRPTEFVGPPSSTSTVPRFEPGRLQFPHAREGAGEWRPIDLSSVVRGLAAFEIGRHGDIKLLGMREAQIRIAGEIVFRQRAAETGIEALFLTKASPSARDNRPG
jgi:hypothetical protein